MAAPTQTFSKRQTRALLARGEAVTTITHDAHKACDWEEGGARAVVVDVHDT